jgi:hypothetical protein
VSILVVNHDHVTPLPGSAVHPYHAL